MSAATFGWFRFIEPNRATIDRGFGERLVDDIIVPDLDGHYGGVFEDVAREFAGKLVMSGELPGTDVGSWWSTGGSHEIDIVGVKRKAPAFAGTVKWRAVPLGYDVYKNLESHAAALGVDASISWLMVGRGGVEARLAQAEHHVRGYSIADLYDQPA